MVSVCCLGCLSDCSSGCAFAFIFSVFNVFCGFHCWWLLIFVVLFLRGFSCFTDFSMLYWCIS